MPMMTSQILKSVDLKKQQQQQTKKKLDILRTKQKQEKIL